MVNIINIHNHDLENCPLIIEVEQEKHQFERYHSVFLKNKPSKVKK